MANATAFFDKTYDEALALAVTARDCLTPDRPRAEPGTSGLVETAASLRLVARIAHVLAWLLDQKAVHAGEITAAEAVGRTEPLASVRACMDEDPALSEPLAGLLVRSRLLYVRVARLDELTRRNIG